VIINTTALKGEDLIKRSPPGKVTRRILSKILAKKIENTLNSEIFFSPKNFL